MADLSSIPADGLDLTWVSPAGDTVEQVSLRWDNEAWTAIGYLAEQRAQYVIRLSPLWHVRQLLLFRDLERPDLWLGTDGHGRWGEINGVHRPELDGAHDVTIAGAVFPHSLLVRRLSLEVGAVTHVSVLVVDAETLAVEPIRHRYERSGAQCWTVAAGGAEAITFGIDEHGLVRSVGSILRQD
jgi:hypothetical protein